MQATPEKRIAKDGVAYTLEEFREYYGVRGTALFSECPSAEESQPEQPHAVAASSEYADSSVLQPAAEHKTLIGSTEDMQRQLQNPGAEQPEPEQPHAAASSSEYAYSCVLQPAAEHTTFTGSTDDMQAPLQNGQAGKLCEVIDNITDDMNWARLQEISASLGMDATFADIDWSSTLGNVWQEASQNTQRCFTTRWSLEDWQQFLFNHALVSVDDLSQYIQSWASIDPNVGHWISGNRAVTNPTANLGGWLADYVYTRFCVLSGQAKPSVRFRVVPNKLYGSLFRMLSTANISKNVKQGNVLEHLCWHAYERRRGEFVLAIVWHTMNRSLLESSSENATATVNTLQLVPHVQPRNHINIKREIFAPLNAECVWNENTNKWTVPANEELSTSICNWASALGPNYPSAEQVTKCVATFFEDEADHNQHGRPRLDIVVTFSNGLQVRYHPKATPIWSNEQQPTTAMEKRMQLMQKLMRRR